MEDGDVDDHGLRKVIDGVDVEVLWDQVDTVLRLVKTANARHAPVGDDLWQRRWYGFDGDAANGDGMVHHYVLEVGIIEGSLLL